MPYSGDPEGVSRDAVRVLVGDTSTSATGEYMGDPEYDFFLAETPNHYVAAQLAANSLAAKFTGAAASGTGDGYLEKTVGDLKIKKADATQAAAQYRALAAEFGRRAAAGVSPYAGGISASDKASIASDSDRVPLPFTPGQFENPNADDFASSS